MYRHVETYIWLYMYICTYIYICSNQLLTTYSPQQIAISNVSSQRCYLIEFSQKSSLWLFTYFLDEETAAKEVVYSRLIPELTSEWKFETTLILKSSHYVSEICITQHQEIIVLVSSNQLRRRKWQSTPVLLPGKSHGHRSLVGYSPWGSQRVRHDWAKAVNQSVNQLRNSVLCQAHSRHTQNICGGVDFI